MSDETRAVGATPGDDTSGLLQSHLLTRDMRNVAEAETIARAYDIHVFVQRIGSPSEKWLTEDLIRLTHKDMFGEIWEWAGRYRKSEKTIGVPWHQIPDQVGRLCQDMVYWQQSAQMNLVEMGARLQHRLTWIHPFENGNGRHARLMTDMFFSLHGHPLPHWPQLQLMQHGEQIRRSYIDAMKLADNGKFENLIHLIQSWLGKDENGI